MIIKYNKDGIRALRLSHNLSPREFAEKVGGKVQRQHIRAWENGTTIGIDNLLRIVNAFRLKDLELFFVPVNSDSNKMESGE